MLASLLRYLQPEHPLLLGLEPAIRDYHCGPKLTQPLQVFDVVRL
jgi:hypothetical protein